MLNWDVKWTLRFQYKAQRCEGAVQSSLNSLSSRHCQNLHKERWENMKPAGLWYGPFEMFPAALLCQWLSDRVQQRPCFCVSLQEIAPAVSHFRYHSLAGLRSEPTPLLQYILRMPWEFDPKSQNFQLSGPFVQMHGKVVWMPLRSQSTA